MLEQRRRLSYSSILIPMAASILENIFTLTGHTCPALPWTVLWVSRTSSFHKGHPISPNCESYLNPSTIRTTCTWEDIPSHPIEDHSVHPILSSIRIAWDCLGTVWEVPCHPTPKYHWDSMGLSGDCLGSAMPSHPQVSLG